ncbi:MAG: hypothetical protein E7466_07260 [Ruminococcaceae bacterium]|nr:hypothetical protein [Oscillospiraceae bacterium]
MSTTPLEQPSAPREGDLFKVIQCHGNTFEIRYGFYEECDRHALFAEPMEIYPNFIKEPQYTDDGIPFVTAIQLPCEKFSGEVDDNSTCEDCSHYQHCEELLGICTCPDNQKE